MRAMEKKISTEEDYLSDPVYICKSSVLITDSLKKGHDVIQLPNGDIITTELKTIMTQYSWEGDKDRFIKTS